MSSNIFSVDSKKIFEDDLEATTVTERMSEIPVSRIQDMDMDKS